MGAVDVERQALNVFRMKLLGAKVHPVKDGHVDAEGRDERGAARLGHQRAHDPLRDRLGRRAAPVPDAGARAAGGDRARGAHADPGGGGAAARRAASRAWAAARTRSACSTPSSPTRRSRSTASRRRATASTPAGTRRRWRAGGSACCTARARTCCATATGRSRRRTRSPPASTIRASAPSTRFLKETGRAKYLSVTDTEALAGLPAPGAHRRDPVRARERARDRGAAEGRGGAAGRRRRHRQRLGARRQGHGDDRVRASV